MVISVDELVHACERAKATAEVRKLARRAARALDGENAARFRGVAMELVLRGCRPFAYELFEARRGRVRELRSRDVEALGRGLATWGDVDCFACFVAGPAWREGVISDTHVARWTRSKDPWKRRLALVATVPLNVANRGGSGDTKRTLAVCARLVDDRESNVVKALSWALRALVSRDAAAVRRFLAENEAHLAALVRREVATKLRTGRKR